MQNLAAQNLVAQSLDQAFASGTAWTPDYHKAWAAGKPQLFDPTPASDAGTAPPPSITADELFELLVRCKHRMARHEQGHVADGESGVVLGLRGVHAHGLTVKGVFDLTALVFPTPLDFSGCKFPDGIVLDDARLGPLKLNRASFPSLQGDAVRIDGDLELMAVAGPWIDLRGSHITGGLFLNGSQLKTGRPSGAALNCSAATVGGDAFLRGEFNAEGEVNFVGAMIGGQFACSGGTFKNPDGRAVSCDAAMIKGDVFLRDAFNAEGEVNFVRATIGGNMQCRQGSFAAPAEQFFAALNLSGAKVAGTLYLTRLQKISGRLDLRDAEAGHFADDGSAWPAPGQLWLDGFQYASFADDWAYGVPGHVKPTPTDFKSRKAWLELQPARDLKETLKPQPWTQCAKVMLSMGHSRDARLILHWRDRLWLKTKQSGRATKLFHWLFLGPFAGYGYKSYYAANWALVFLALGLAIFAGAYEKGLMWRTDESGPYFSAETFHPIGYTLDAFLPGISLGETKLWRPHGKAEAEYPDRGAKHTVRTLTTIWRLPAWSWPFDWALDQGLARVWLWVETIMGWVLAAVLAAGLSGVLQRQTE